MEAKAFTRTVSLNGSRYIEDLLLDIDPTAETSAHMPSLMQEFDQITVVEGGVSKLYSVHEIQRDKRGFPTHMKLRLVKNNG